MITPFLIQRGIIKKFHNIPKLDCSEGRLSRRVGMDYMGSAEFEALPGSLKRIEKKFENYTIITVNEINSKTSLKFFSCFKEDELKEYIEFLKKIRDNKLHLKERAEFNEGTKFTFWWDIVCGVLIKNL